jgi:hypothetical protein
LLWLIVIFWTDYNVSRPRRWWWHGFSKKKKGKMNRDSRHLAAQILSSLSAYTIVWKLQDLGFSKESLLTSPVNYLNKAIIWLLIVECAIAWNLLSAVRFLSSMSSIG